MMRAMILAAGRGERMGQLTTQTPKPLLRVGENYLIEYVIAALRRAGISEIVINLSYLGEQIQSALGDGKRYGATIYYSVEPERLETGGGIFQALPLLGKEPFLVMSSDIITDYPLQQLPRHLGGLAHLLMVDNPAFHASGDFELQQGLITLGTDPKSKLTFGNIGVYHPKLFAGCEPGHFRLTKVLLPAITRGQVTGEHYRGIWHNVGSIDDLSIVNKRAREDSNLRPLASETNTLSN
jgi:MurNAc alpha-1-phosphate uridylyltransferase